jgi:hypothetical protein
MCKLNFQYFQAYETIEYGFSHKGFYMWEAIM